MINDQLGKSLQHSVNQKFGRGTYQVLQPIKRGADGYVYKIQYIRQKRLGALKVMARHSLNIEPQSNLQESKKKYRKDTDLQKKAQNEIKIHEMLRSNYIVKLYNSYKDDMNYYLFLEYIKNGDLSDLIVMNKGGLSIGRVRNIGLQIAKGIDTMHKKNIIHRDIKPQNILLTEDDEIKICDFSCAKVVNLEQNQLIKGVIGTLDFMAPEILDKYSVSVDIWSFACVIYTMVTGHPPFKLQKQQLRQHIRQIKKDTIAEFNKKLVQQMMNRWEQKKSLAVQNNKMSCCCQTTNHNQCYKKLAYLLKSTLLFDPSKRLSLEKIIKHPFFTGEKVDPILEQQMNKMDEIGSEVEYKTLRQQSVGKIKENKSKMTQILTTYTQSNRKAPKTSYSLQNIKKLMNRDREKAKQDPGSHQKLGKTQSIIEKYSEKYALINNLNCNLHNKQKNNKTTMQSYRNRVSQSKDQSKSKVDNEASNKTTNNASNKQNSSHSQMRRPDDLNNENINTQNINLQTQNNNKQSSGYKDASTIFKLKINDRKMNDHQLEYNKHPNPKQINKFIGDGNCRLSPILSSNSSNAPSLQYSLEPLNLQGLTYRIRFPQKQQVITINEEGLKGQFLRSNKAMLISPKGKHITVIFENKKKTYELERLPEKYMGLYENYRQVVEQVRRNRQRKASKQKERQKQRQGRAKNRQDRKFSSQKISYAQLQNQKPIPSHSKQNKFEVNTQCILPINIRQSRNNPQRSNRQNIYPCQLSVSKRLKGEKKGNVTIQVCLHQEKIEKSQTELTEASLNMLSLQKVRQVILQLVCKAIVRKQLRQHEKQQYFSNVLEENYELFQQNSAFVLNYCKWLNSMPHPSSDHNAIKSREKGRNDEKNNWNLADKHYNARNLLQNNIQKYR